MRTVTPQAQALLDQKLGTEIMILVEVDWVSDTTILYSDQDLEGAEPNIVSIGGFDTSMMLSGSTDTQELSVVLDDTNGDLRVIYNSNDIHKRPARLYMLHKGLDISNRILLFRGEVVTPLQWDESQRTMSFNILSKLDAKQVGFSMEEGDFPNIPEEALGKAWPLVFGEICHLPAVKVRAPRRGYLETGLGIKDFTLDVRLCQALKIECPSQSQGLQDFYQQMVNNEWNVTQQTTYGVDIECANRAFGEICKLRDLISQQNAYIHDTVTISNGVSFPQGESVDLFIDNAIVTGVFTGNSFSITNRQHPDYTTFDHVPCKDVAQSGYSSGSAEALEFICGNIACYFKDLATGWAYNIDVRDKVAYWQAQNEEGPWGIGNTGEESLITTCEQILSPITGSGLVGGAKDAWTYYDALEEASFFWAPAGSDVYMESESEILYTVSLIPGIVTKVSAYRTAANGFRYLTEVPTDYYTVYLTDYTGYQVTEIGMNKALTLYDDSWEDQLYVSFISSVGPNPCDIIEWLVNKYTDLTVDSSSFAAVKSYMSNYPQNFAVTDRPDVYQLINDIAYQSRCSVYIRNNVIYIKYLSLEPSSERTISESDILFGTFQESLSETEEVYTTHNVTWRKGGATVRDDQSLDHKIILKYNVDKYGTVEQGWDYFTYNIYELALKSATFWLIRKATSWKKIMFEVPLKHIDLDVGDCITVDVAQFGSAVKCIIEQSTYNPDNNTLSMQCWTPVRAGETEAYHWAWPSQQPAPGVWPMPLDTHGGAGYDFEVVPPVGHILLGGAHRDDQLVITSGDLHPSDLDDTLPLLECESSDYINFDEEDPAIVAKTIAQSAARQSMQNTVADNSGAQGSNDTKKRSISECGHAPGGCGYKINVMWHTSHAQGTAGCGGPCRCASGCPTCYGPQWTVCHTFTSAGGASSFGAYMDATYGKSIGDTWSCMETAVIGVSIYAGPNQPSGCADPYTAVPDASDGETPSSEVGEPIGETGDETT